jgi:signal transduction histidine kinase
MAERLAEATGADRAVVWLADGAGLHAAATAPVDAQPEQSAASIDEIHGVAVPIEHEGEMLGALSAEKGRGDPLTPTELRLVEDLAGSAGLVVRRLRLDEALTARAIELAESRRRLVDAQDVERRRLERTLHDGAQQQVVALKVKLGLARQLAATERTERAAIFIDQMESEAQDAIEQIRALAQGIYPPLLEADGLAAVIPALTAPSPLDVEAQVELGGRHPLPLEGAIYFCVSEALTNAAKHGRGPVTVSISDTTDALAFAVTDSGPGFDPALGSRGAGLDNIADRLEALGGRMSITSAPGSPTTIAGSVPLLVTAS